MIETVTAVMGLLSAGIFLAHAVEGFRYLGPEKEGGPLLNEKKTHDCSFQERPVRKALINSDEHLTWQV